MGSELALLPLAAPPSISLPPFLLSTCLFTEWSQFLEQGGELIFFALPFGRGRVACGMKHGKLSRRQTPLAQTSWGPRLVLRGQVVSYSYGVTEHSLLHRVRPERQTGASITLIQSPGPDESPPGQRGDLLPRGSENFWAETMVELGLERQGMKEKPCSSRSVRNSVRAAWGEPEWLVGQCSGCAWPCGSRSWGLTSQAMSEVLVYILMCVGPFLFFAVNSPVLSST